jgi:hypothetical protein
MVMEVDGVKGSQLEMLPLSNPLQSSQLDIPLQLFLLKEATTISHITIPDHPHHFILTRTMASRDLLEEAVEDMDHHHPNTSQFTTHLSHLDLSTEFHMVDPSQDLFSATDQHMEDPEQALEDPVETLEDLEEVSEDLEDLEAVSEDPEQTLEDLDQVTRQSSSMFTIMFITLLLLEPLEDLVSIIRPEPITKLTSPTLLHNIFIFPGYGNAVYGQIGAGEYGLGAKNPISVATPSGKPIGGNYPQNPAFLGTANNAPGGNFNGDYNRVEDCTCVRLSECPAYDVISSQGTTGKEVISGLGQPNFGQVGFGIDPRNKLNTGIESNSTEDANSEESSQESQNHARSFKSNIEALSSEEEDEATTTLSPTSVDEETSAEVNKTASTRRRRNIPESPKQSELEAQASGDGDTQPVSLPSPFKINLEPRSHFLT